QGSIVKELKLSENNLSVAYSLSGELTGSIACEINLAMPSCDGVGGRYIKNGVEVLGGFGQNFDLDELTNITLDDIVLQGALILRISEPVKLQANPHFSVSQSEGGVEKI